jgi:tetratricopeptide (TPR) repeat protein
MTRRRWVLIAAAVALAPFVFYCSSGQSAPNDPLAPLYPAPRPAPPARDYQRAVDLYTQGLADSSHPAAVRRNLIRQRAFAYENLRQYDRAEADYNAALQIEPVDPDFYAKRGFYLTRRGRYDDALADFRKGAELDPADSGYAFGEAGVYQKLGQHDKAVERYSEAIRKNPKIANYYRERGSAYNYLGKFKEAHADYDKALALGYPAPWPRETACSNLGRDYASLKLEDYRRAIDDFDAVLKVVPRSSNALGWRGAAYQGLGKTPEAIADYKASLAIDPKNERALEGLKSLGQPVP